MDLRKPGGSIVKIDRNVLKFQVKIRSYMSLTSVVFDMLNHFTRLNYVTVWSRGVAEERKQEKWMVRHFVLATA